MGLLAGGRWGRQAQAPEPGLGSGGRPIAGGRGPGGAQVAVPRAQPWGELESKQPGSRWRCHARERPGRGRGFGAGQEDAERRQGRESLSESHPCHHKKKKKKERKPLRQRPCPLLEEGQHVLPGMWGSQGSWCSGGLCGFPDTPLPWPEATRLCLQPSHSTPSPRRPLEFSRWKFTSEALWPHIRQPVSSPVPPPLNPSCPVGSRTGAPQDHRALLPGGSGRGRRRAPW